MVNHGKKDRCSLLWWTAISVLHSSVICSVTTPSLERTSAVLKSNTTRRSAGGHKVNDTAESFTHRNSTLTFNSLFIHSVKPMSDCYRDVSCAHFRFDLQTKFKTRFLRTVWLFPARLTASVSQFDFLLVTYPVSKISDLLFQSLDNKVYCVQHLRDHCNINTKYLPTY